MCNGIHAAHNRRAMPRHRSAKLVGFCILILAMSQLVDDEDEPDFFTVAALMVAGDFIFDD